MKLYKLQGLGLVSVSEYWNNSRIATRGNSVLHYIAFEPSTYDNRCLDMLTM